MQLQGDAWCSSGNLWPNGNLMATGGTFSGDKAIRVIANDDPNGDFTTKIGALADTRWYVTNTIISIMFEIISCTEIKCTTGSHLSRSCQWKFSRVGRRLGQHQKKDGTFMYKLYRI